MPTDDTPDPVDELAAVLGETLRANALRLTTTRGGYVGGGQPHPELSSDAGAIEAIARGLLARRVAEPSRTLPTDDTRPDPVVLVRDALRKVFRDMRDADGDEMYWTNEEAVDLIDALHHAGLTLASGTDDTRPEYPAGTVLRVEDMTPMHRDPE